MEPEYDIPIFREVETMCEAIYENDNLRLLEIAVYSIFHLHKVLGDYPDKGEGIQFHDGRIHSLNKTREMLLNEKDLVEKFPVDALYNWAKKKLAELES